MVLGNAEKMLILTDGNKNNASARIRAILYIPYLRQKAFLSVLFPEFLKNYRE
jgi:hypothetical protein